MAWETPLPIFEDEDEEELIAQFVSYSAKYEDKGYSPYQIAWEIFKTLKDPEMRSNQAAMAWSNNLSIRIRIDEAKLNGGVEPNPVDSKETKLRKLESIYNNMELHPRDRIKALELHAKISGEIDGDGDDETGTRRPIVMNFGVDPRSDPKARVADAA